MRDALLALMGADAEVLGRRATFTVIMLGGNVVIVLIFLNNAIFRAAGDAAIAMRVLWIANAINLVLDPLLIFGLGPFPELGVVGAAVATTTGRVDGGADPAVAAAVRAAGASTIARRHLRLAPAVMWTVCRLSGTGLFQILVSTTSWIGLVRVISSFGSAGAGRLHDRHPHDPVRAAAVVGARQCRRDDGGAGAGGGEAGAGRAAPCGRRASTTWSSSASSGLVFVVFDAGDRRASTPTIRRWPATR